MTKIKEPATEPNPDWLGQAQKHIEALILELDTAAMMAGSNAEDNGAREDNWPAYHTAKEYLKALEDMRRTKEDND